MKGYTQFKIITWTATLIVLLLSIILTIMSYDFEKDIEIVPCYDRYGNELIGVNCEEEVFVNESEEVLYYISLLSPFLFVIMFFFSMMLVFEKE